MAIFYLLLFWYELFKDCFYICYKQYIILISMALIESLNPVISGIYKNIMVLNKHGFVNEYWNIIIQIVSLHCNYGNLKTAI